MTTTELIELLKKNERGGATGRPREVMFEVGDRIIDTDGIEVTGSGDGLISELYLSLPSAQPDKGYIEQIKWERDLAIQQLADLGYGLGEKPRTQDYKTDHGYMWPCPKCGLPVHSDFEKCVRCGYER